jgi:hypothetical protein
MEVQKRFLDVFASCVHRLCIVDLCSSSAGLRRW